MRRLSLGLIALLLLVATGRAQVLPSSTSLPASFDEGRVHLHPVTKAGDTLRLNLDTGGRTYFYRETVERLGWPVRDTTISGRTHSVTNHPSLRRPGMFAGDAIGVPLVHERRPIDRRLHPEADGLLGTRWFAGRVWRIDYVAEDLHLLESAPEGMAQSQHAIAMGFPTDSEGDRLTHFPSIEATISGTTYPFLLDTGATLLLSEKGRAELGGAGVRAASYVVESVFEEWRREHPDWKVVEGGSVYGGGSPMIRVPTVTIAGHTVGPVWFVQRPDGAFHGKMAQLMDRPVDGALGGSLFQYFELTLDYPNARARFRRSEGPIYAREPDGRR